MPKNALISSLVRMWYFLVDHLHTHRWWVKTADPPAAEVHWLTIPGVPGLGKKSEDPAWRLNRPWVLLRLSGRRPYEVYFSSVEQGSSYRNRMPINTTYIAMRAGSEDTYVTAIDHGLVYMRPIPVPLVNFLGSTQKMTEEKMRRYCEREGIEVTFI